MCRAQQFLCSLCFPISLCSCRSHEQAQLSNTCGEHVPPHACGIRQRALQQSPTHYATAAALQACCMMHVTAWDAAAGAMLRRRTVYCIAGPRPGMQAAGSSRSCARNRMHAVAAVSQGISLLVWLRGSCSARLSSHCVLCDQLPRTSALFSLVLCSRRARSKHHPHRDRPSLSPLQRLTVPDRQHGVGLRFRPYVFHCFPLLIGLQGQSHCFYNRVTLIVSATTDSLCHSLFMLLSM